MQAVAVNLRDDFILLDTDDVVVIDTLIDSEGDETRDKTQAVAAIAPLPDARWIAVDLNQFEHRAAH